MNVLESSLILAATLSALWWAFARHRAPVALERLSLAGLGLGVLAVALEGVHWQLVPWQLLAWRVPPSPCCGVIGWRAPDGSSGCSGGRLWWWASSPEGWGCSPPAFPSS